MIEIRHRKTGQILLCLEGDELAGIDRSQSENSGTGNPLPLMRPTGLAGVDLQEADLHLMDFAGANFRGANLAEADLHGANLFRAHLAEANLRGALLFYANLYEADCRNADLRGANLRGAWLNRADLSGAQLEEAILAEAHYDAGTRWPDGFDPCVHGAIPHQ